MDTVQLRLASGLQVNSAIDNPQRFFTSFNLKNRAADLTRLLDGIGQSIRTVQEADHGIKALQKIIELTEAKTLEGLQTLRAGREDLSDIILADDPVAYWRLDETTGNVAENLGTAGTSIDGTYAGGTTLNQDPLYFGGRNSASFDGNNDRVNIPDSLLINADTAGYPARTIELVFDADTTVGRQVLYEEGGTTNSFAMYINNGRVHVEARDAGDFGPFNISAEIEAGKSYHLAFTFSSADSEFIGYLDGEIIGTGVVTKPMNRHTANIAIGRKTGGVHYHDGGSGGNGDNFSGRISDVALYNDTLTQSDIRERFDATQLAISRALEEEFLNIVQEVDPIVEDAKYRGINLLGRDTLITFFNERQTSFLELTGANFSADQFGFIRPDFRLEDNFTPVINNIKYALTDVRQFGSSLANRFSIIQTREEFTKSTINTLLAGSDDLTLSDQNKEGANFLALQVRQQIQFSALSAANSPGIAQLLL